MKCFVERWEVACAGWKWKTRGTANYKQKLQDYSKLESKEGKHFPPQRSKNSVVKFPVSKVKSSSVTFELLNTDIIIKNTAIVIGEQTSFYHKSTRKSF